MRIANFVNDILLSQIDDRNKGKTGVTILQTRNYYKFVCPSPPCIKIYLLHVLKQLFKLVGGP